jgi:high-affinity iron transporter
MLTWHNVWMSTHGREMAKDARDLGVQVVKGNKTLAAITAVVAIAVLREGSEVVLFLYGLLASDGGGWKVVFSGGVFGLLLGAISTALIYWGLVAIPVRHFFSATTWLITFLAAGLAAQGIAFLQQGGYLEQWSTPVWNTSQILAQGDWVGRLLHTLIGYCDQPTGMQIAAYLFTLFSISILLQASKLKTKWSFARGHASTLE